MPKRLTIPVVKVDFSQWSPTGDLDADKTAGRLIDAVEYFLSLACKCRTAFADAILRDSEIEEEQERLRMEKKIPKVAFRKSRKRQCAEYGQPAERHGTLPTVPNGADFAPACGIRPGRKGEPGQSSSGRWFRK